MNSTSSNLTSTTTPATSIPSTVAIEGDDLLFFSNLISLPKLIIYTRTLLNLIPNLPHRSPSLTTSTTTTTAIPATSTDGNVGVEGRRPSSLIDRTNPLSVLLFLLNCLIYLRGSVNDDIVQLETNRSSNDNNEGNEGNKGIELEDWESWKNYIQEVYLYSPNNLNKRASTQALWSSPLSISNLILPSVTNSFTNCENLTSTSSTLNKQKVKEMILEACQFSYIYLASLPNSLTGENGIIVSSTLAANRIELLLSLPLENFPPPLPKPLLDIISTTLSSRRRMIGPTSNVYDTLSSIEPSPLTFRSILATILEHFFGGDKFGLMKGKDGEWRYAKDELDNENIKGFYREREINGKGEEDSSDRSASVRVAMLSISGREDMAKYIPKNSHDALENRNSSTTNYSGSNSPPPIYTATSDSRSMNQFHHQQNSSIDSFNSAKNSQLHSTSSGNLSKDSSSHRRAYSSASNRDSIDPGAATRALAVTPDHVPFSNLAPLPSSYTSPTTSPRLIQSSLTVNTLSIEEKRDLVRRSKKLQQVLGEPLREGVVEKVFPPTNAFSNPNSNDRIVLRGGNPYRSNLDTEEEVTMFNSSGTSTIKKISRPNLGKSRRSSYPPPSPSPFSSFVNVFNNNSTPSIIPTSTSNLAESNSTFISVPMSRALSSPQSSTRTTFFDLSPTSLGSEGQNSPDFYEDKERRPSMTVKEQQKEERRRKLEKLQRLLGERVPNHLALNDTIGIVSTTNNNNNAFYSGLGSTTSSNNSNRNSKLGGGLFKVKGALGLNSTEKSKREELEENNFRWSGGNWDQRVSTFNNGSSDVIGSRKKEEEVLIIDGNNNSNDAGGQAILGLTKARKLEQVFGDLPPKSLYLNRSGSIQMDNNNSLLSPPISIDNERRPSYYTNPRALDRYRNSIASLSYLIERDPDSLVDDITKVYRTNSSSSTTKTGGGLEEDEEIGGEEGEEDYKPLLPTTTGNTKNEVIFGEYRPVIPAKSDRRVLRSEDYSSRIIVGGEDENSKEGSGGKRITKQVSNTSLTDTLPGTGVKRSMSRARTAKKATKLANFFGTTRGEVWENLLHDLEEAIVEEEGIDEEERLEVLGGVTKLRLAGRDRRGIPTPVIVGTGGGVGGVRRDL